MNFAALFGQGLAYEAFLRKYGNDEQQRRWSGVHATSRSVGAAETTTPSFTREMKVLILAGTWCGDCAKLRSDLRPLCRPERQDRHPLLRSRRQSGIGPGDVDLRGIARTVRPLFERGRFFLAVLAGTGHFPLIGTSSPANSVPRVLHRCSPEKTLLQNVVQDWLDEFERIQLMLRTSGRLRQLHGD